MALYVIYRCNPKSRPIIIDNMMIPRFIAIVITLIMITIVSILLLLSLRIPTDAIETPNLGSS